MLTFDDDIMRQLRATFKVEAAEHVQAMNRILLALEEGPQGDKRSQLLEEIFREAHSLKGAAGAADLGDVEKTAHRLESILGATKSGDIELTADLCDVVYEGVDAISVIVEAALEDRQHGLDLPDLLARLDAAKEGKVIPRPHAATLPPSEGTATSDVEPGKAEPEEQAEVALKQAQPEPAVVVLKALKEPAASMTPPAPKRPEQKPAEAPTSPQMPAKEVARDSARAVQAKGPKADDHKARPKGDDDAEETIRVNTSKLDALMTQAGELLVAGLKIDQRLQEVQEMYHAIEDWNREWLKVRATYSHMLHDNKHEEIRPLFKFLDTNQQRLKALATEVGDLRRGFAGDALHLSRVTNDLGEGVMRVRMLPVSTVLDMFPRMVRDVSRERGKEVDLQIEGGDTELDRKVLEEIKDPLMHLLRNAIDHGLEMPEERERAGKSRRGTVTVSAFQKGNNIVIEVRDDGAGINVQRVKQAALKGKLISSDEAETMTDEEAFRLIFAPGLSTSAVVTDISGRGVGMDVVRRNIEGLRGQVDVDSAPGQGTKITLILPLTLATTQELLIQVSNQTYGLPISAVERIQRINPEDISSVEGKEAIVVDNEPVSLVHLGDVLGLPRDTENGKSDQKMPVVILNSVKKRIAFLVDGVVGQQESVVKSLGKQLSRVPNVAGATILGTGQVIMTLNPVDLTMSARMTEGRSMKAVQTAQAKVEAVKRPTVLVVDDSLTTRTLEKNILETAGYEVKLATDGAEALDILQADGCDLVVSDVLMPRMNGLELTETIRGNPKLKEVPIVLVTSLDSREDREKGIELGANAYVVKSNFDQANLLQTIEQFV